MPERSGPWDRVYDLFRRRQRDGTRARILWAVRCRRGEPQCHDPERAQHQVGMAVHQRHG
ncbi:hypothetical protein ACWDFR_27500 [Streptomyces sp. 900105755]